MSRRGESFSCDVTYKVLLLGDSGVGKTSLIRALSGKTFSHSMVPTVGIDFVNVTFPVDGARVRLQIWDTAGQERFRSITRFQYRGTKGLMLVYDVTNRKSFEMLNYWINTIEQDLDQHSKDSVPIVIVGNKSDLTERRAVSAAEGRKIAERNVTCGFWETSASLGSNVMESFTHLAHTLTDLYNPLLMDMYKYSAAVDRINGSTYPENESALPPDSNTDSSPFTSIIISPAAAAPSKSNKPFRLHHKLKNRKKCDCRRF